MAQNIGLCTDMPKKPEIGHTNPFKFNLGFVTDWYNND